jgi:hypothetical protein
LSQKRVEQKGSGVFFNCRHTTLKHTNPKRK